MQTRDLLDRLVAFPTVSSVSNLALIDFVATFLAERGIESQRVEDQAVGKAGLIATIGPKVEGGIVLSGHTDVVPTEGQNWSSDPFRLTARDGKLFGRGATDMKGFLAAMLRAADRAASSPLKLPLHLVFSYDEEVGCLGIRPMLAPLGRLLPAPGLCIVGEPTSMRVATGHKGKIAARAECRGVAGHSSMAPLSLNALHLAADFIQLLRRQQEEVAASGRRDAAYDIPYSTLHAGRLCGGTALNIVPAQAEVEFEIRHLAGEGHLFERLEREVETIIATYRDRFPQAAIEVTQTNTYPGLETLRPAEALTAMRRFIDAPAPIKVAYGTEAGLIQEALGVPAVVCGPGSMEQGHKPDEFIQETELARCDAMLDRIIDSLRV